MFPIRVKAFFAVISFSLPIVAATRTKGSIGSMLETQAAPRFTLRLPMRYRPQGESRWRDSMREIVSTSGLRFIASELLPSGAGSRSR